MIREPIGSAGSRPQGILCIPPAQPMVMITVEFPMYGFRNNLLSFAIRDSCPLHISGLLKILCQQSKAQKAIVCMKRNCPLTAVPFSEQTFFADAGPQVRIVLCASIIRHHLSQQVFPPKCRINTSGYQRYKKKHRSLSNSGC